MKKNALQIPPNPAKEKTTWGEVCSQVGFADNLYRTCRDKLKDGFQPHNMFGDMGDYDEEFEDYDVDKELKKSALPIPKAPPADWKPEPEGFLEQLVSGDLTKKIAIYGGGALLAWYLWDKFMSPPKTTSAPATPALSAPIATALHLPASPQVSDNAKTTVEIPASLRV